MTHGSLILAGRPYDGPPRLFTIDARDGVTFALYRDLALRENAIHSRTVVWACDLARLPDLGRPVASGRNQYVEAQLVRRGAVICFVRLGNDGLVHTSISACDRDSLDAAERELRDLLPSPADNDDGSPSVTVRFWNYGRDEPRARRIEVPSWDDIQGNYPSRTLGDLAPLMSSFRPGVSGQLLMWHGPPGTGKTFALRALLWEWREWCAAHYVVDPEYLLGSPSYMVDMLTSSSSARDTLEADYDALDGKPAIARTESQRWRLLILEDSGELLSIDAKERQGQTISRLLNIVDGLIGQGLRLLILITANEPLRTLHPALSRTGRCASVVEFAAFTPDEAAAWLAARGTATGSASSGTLSDLYAAVGDDDRRTTSAQRRVGFA
jgi:hypothetical protein